jgi:hypothetical protein
MYPETSAQVTQWAHIASNSLVVDPHSSHRCEPFGVSLTFSPPNLILRAPEHRYLSYFGRIWILFGIPDLGLRRMHRRHFQAFMAANSRIKGIP